MIDRDALRAKALRLMRPDAPLIRGYVARGGRLVPWYEADTAVDGSIKNPKATAQERQLMASLHGNLPPVKVRTPQERLKEMTDTLVKTAVRHGDGTYSFPRSVSREIAVFIGKHSGDFVTEETIEAYAAHLLEEAEKKNKPTREVKLAQP